MRSTAVAFRPIATASRTAERRRLALHRPALDPPGGDGIALLERATLPDGSPAFDSRELGTCATSAVGSGAAYRAQLVALVVLLALAIGCRRSAALAHRRAVGAAARLVLTLGIAVLAVPVILLGFDGFFLRFHEVFFSGDSWRFSDTDTLLRIYPETFWQDTAKLAAAIVVAQAIVVGARGRLVDPPACRLRPSATVGGRIVIELAQPVRAACSGSVTAARRPSRPRTRCARSGRRSRSAST